MFSIAVFILLIMPTLFSNDLSLCSSLTVPGKVYVIQREVSLSELRLQSICENLPAASTFYIVIHYYYYYYYYYFYYCYYQ